NGPSPEKVHPFPKRPSDRDLLFSAPRVSAQWLVQAVSKCQAAVLIDMSIPPSPKHVAVDALGPDILPVAIDLGDAGIPPAGGQHAAVGQPRGVRRVRSVGLPGDFAGPVHFDDLVVVVLGDQHISAGKELSVAPRSQPAYLHGTEALARGIHL